MQEMQCSLDAYEQEARHLGCIADAAMSVDSNAAANVWRIRGGISASLSRHGA